MPFGGVVSSVEEIPTCFGVEIITSVAEGVCAGYCRVCVVDNSTVSVCIISIFSLLCNCIIRTLALISAF